MSDQTNNSEEDVKLSNEDAETQAINKDSSTEEVAKEEAPTEEVAKEEAPTEEVAKEEAPTEEVTEEEVPTEEVTEEEVPTEEVAKEEVPTEKVAKEEVPTEESDEVTAEPNGTDQILMKLDNLANPYEQQLKQAKNLILTLSGVTGIVLVISITFFIVMSMSIAQKVDELDRVLMAVAKRGIQLADGIETIAEMEVKIQKVIEKTDEVSSNLGKLENSLVQSSQELKLEGKSAQEAISKQNSNVLKGQEDMLKTLNGGVDEIEKLIEKSVKLAPLERGQSSLEMQVKDLGKTLLAVEKKVQDLYVIKQAEMESVLKGLSRNE